MNEQFKSNRTGDNIVSRLQSFNTFKQQASEKKAQQNKEQMASDSRMLFQSGLDATDDNVKKACDKECRKNLVGQMILNYYNSNGNHEWDSRTTTDIMNGFISANQNTFEPIKQFVNSDQDEIEFGRQMGWISDNEVREAEESSIFQDVVGGAYDSATGIPRMIGKGTANAIGWVAKQFGADEDKVNELVNSYKNYIDSDWSGEAIGADTDSISYNVAKGVGDLVQTAAYGTLAKGALTQGGLGKVVSDAVKSGPKAGKLIAGAIEGAADMGIYSAVADSELPSGGDLAIGAVGGAVAPFLGTGLKAAGKAIKAGTRKAAAGLELSGMLNPAKLTEVKNRLIDEGTDLASAGLRKGSAEDVGTWMIERDMKGDKPTIIEKLGNHASKAREMKLAELSKSTTEQKIPSATKSLNLIYNTIADIPGLEKTTQRVSELMSKSKYTWKEADEIKSILDDTFDIFTNAGDVRAGATKKGLANVRRELKKAIEDGATAEGLGDIRMLNNEIQIAKGLQQGISKKDSADVAREILSVFSRPLVGGVIGSSTGPFDSSTFGGKVGNVLLGAMAGRYLLSTSSKTKMASILNKLSGGTKKELERLVSGGGAKLSEGAEKELVKGLEEIDILPVEVAEGISQEEKEALAKYVQNSLFE